MRYREIKIPAQGRSSDYKFYGAGTSNIISASFGSSSSGSGKSWLESYVKLDSENDFLNFLKDIKVPNLYITGQVNHWLEDVITVADASLQLNAVQDGARVESGLIVFNQDETTELSKLYYDTDNVWKIDGIKIATREDNPLSNGITYWDSSESMFKTRSRAFDSDKLEGLSSSQFLRSDANDSASGVYTFNSGEFCSVRIVRNVTGASSGGIRFGNNSQLYEFFGNDTRVGLRLEGSDDYLMVWGSNGNVGIGTTLPSEKLHVNGNYLVTGIGKFGSDLVTSGTFVSGFAGSGWKLDGSESHLTVDKLTVRKEMNIYELIINKIRSSNGAFAVSDAFECGAYSKYGTNPITYKIYKKEGDSRSFPFVVGDFVKAQEFDNPTLRFFTGRVYNVTDDILYVRLLSGEPWDNMTLFRYDSEEDDRRGFIYLTASDEYAPYLDVVEGTGTGVWNVPKKIRYIRDWLNGNTWNNGNHTVEIQAFDKDGNNKALGKDIIDGGVVKSGTTVTDGNTATNPYYSFPSGLNNIIVDLGEVTEIEYIKIWHYYYDGRTYHNTKTEVSADGETWYTVFDSAIQGEYPETSSGKTHYLGSKQTTRLRLGKLSGISGQSGYGIWASRDGSSTDFVISSDGYAQIAGWGFNKESLYKTHGNLKLSLGKAYYWESGAYGLQVGQDRSNRVWIGATETNYELAMWKDGKYYFKLALNGTKIAGFSFDDTYLYTNKYGYDSGIELRGGSAPRLIVHKDYENYVANFYNNDNDWGIAGKKDGKYAFQFGSTNQFAGVNFDNSRLWTANWELKADGTATFTKGNIAGWDFDKNKLSKTFDTRKISIGLVETWSGGNEVYGIRIGNSDLTNTGRILIYQDSTNQSYGISHYNGSEFTFRLGSTNQIAGINFNDEKLYTSKWSLNKDGSFSFGSGKITGDASGNVTIDNVTIDSSHFVNVRKFVLRPYVSTAVSNSSSSPTTIDTSKYGCAIVSNGTGSSKGYIKLSNGQNGQIFVVFPRNDSGSIRVYGYMKSENYIDLAGGEVGVFMFVSSSMYNPNVSNRWILISRLDNNW